jgi:hypothetical protein
MFERRPAITVRFPKLVFLFDFLGVLTFLGIAIAGGLILSGNLELGTTDLPPQTPEEILASALDRSPAVVPGIVALCFGLVLLVLEWHLLRLHLGKRAALEYEETAEGIDLFRFGARRGGRLKRSIPRRSHVVLEVTRETTSELGLLKNRTVRILVDGREIDRQPVASVRGTDALQRLSYAPLRDIVERQGGTVVAADPSLEEALFSPAR